MMDLSTQGLSSELYKEEPAGKGDGGGGWKKQAAQSQVPLLIRRVLPPPPNYFLGLDTIRIKIFFGNPKQSLRPARSLPAASLAILWKVLGVSARVSRPSVPTCPPLLSRVFL